MQIPIVGIIAEYNPFHKGHAHHIKTAINNTKAESVIVILSSDFVQRGEPALTSKWDRAETALQSGADLVLELPSAFSAHNAGVFANGAIDTLYATGIVSHIAFGSENPKWCTHNILDILNEEPEKFKLQLKSFLKQGYSYVESRSLALDYMVPGTYDEIKKPNNLLGLAYLCRISKLKANITPVAIQRIGSAYNNYELTNIASATAIRREIFNNQFDDIKSYITKESFDILQKAMQNGTTVTSYDKLWQLLRYKLITTPAEEIRNIAEISEGIEYKLKKEALERQSYDEWVKACTSKRYPASKIKRSGLHILLGLNHWTNRAIQRLGVPYIRVLGMNKKGRNCLRRMKQVAKLPIVTKYGECSAISSYAETIMQYELNACEIRNQISDKPKFGIEHKHPIILYH